MELMTRLFLASLGLLFATAAYPQAETAAGQTLPVTMLNNLVQGRVYSPNYFPIRGNPFITDTWRPTDVRLLDQEFPAMAIWYDIYADDLILLHRRQKKAWYIMLNKEQIQDFSFDNRQFINLEHSRYRDLDLDKGFYELVFEGQVSMLVKRSLELAQDSDELFTYFSRKDRRFLIRNGQPYRVSSKKSFLQAAGETHKKEMSGFIKKQKIRFKKIEEAEWRQLVTYLNSLS